MKTQCLIISLLVGLSVSLYAQHKASTQSIDSLRRDFMVDADEMKREFDDYVRQAQEDYQRYEAQARMEYLRYAAEVKRIWGETADGGIVEDTRNLWVEYGKGFDSRSVVDFDKGEIVVEVALEGAEKENPQIREKKLEEAVRRLLESRGSSCPYASKVDKQEPLTRRPILEGLVDFSPYPQLTGEEAMFPGEEEEILSAEVGKVGKTGHEPPKPQVKGKALPTHRKPNNSSHTRTSHTSADSAGSSRHSSSSDDSSSDDASAGSSDRFSAVSSDTSSRGNLASRRMGGESGTVDRGGATSSRENARERARQRAGEKAQKREAQRAGEKTRLQKGTGPRPSLAARIIAQQSDKQLTQVKGNDGQVRQVVALRMNMVTDNLSRNAALYKELVAEFSNRYQVEQPLIFAVMEQESYFNPEAASWVPAYGLMQLVPHSGGRHAYRFVYGKEWCPTRSYLFNPRNNIELGTAYLRVLLNQFALVNDYDCRRLCAIASYNTGSGNVSRAFTGNTSVVQAVPHINRLDYASLYTYLTTRLSTNEARNYVAGVTKRMGKYAK